MKITLYKAFPDRFRRSMDVYCDRLQESLSLFANLKVNSYRPKNIFLKPKPARYFSQYLHYQVSASFQQGDINHITDHAYAHLAHTLNPQKTIITFHDAIRIKKIKQSGREKNIHKQLMNYNASAIHKAARILCDSESSKADLIQYVKCPAEKIEVIPLGVDESLFEADEGPCKRLGIAEGEYVIHVGHVGEYKNIPALFHVLQSIKKRRPNVKLLKVGSDFTEDQLVLIKKLALEDSIIHLGFIPQSELRLAYQTADCLLFPSEDEGFGFPLLEAMACGTPVVCSNRGSLPELVEGAGYCFDPHDYHGMADQIGALLEDGSLRNELIQKGKDRARLYTWKKVAEKTLGVYQSVHEEYLRSRRKG